MDKWEKVEVVAARKLYYIVWKLQKDAKDIQFWFYLLSFLKDLGVLFGEIFAMRQVL